MVTEDITRPEDQTLNVDGKSFTKNQVLENLQYGINLLDRDMKAAANSPEITEQQMLFVNKQGQRATFNDPGARAVDTVDERDELAAKDKGAAGLMVTEELVLDDKGHRVKAADYYFNLSGREQMDEMTRAFKDVEEGRVQLSQLPENIKEKVLEMEAAKLREQQATSLAMISLVEKIPGVEALENKTGISLNSLFGQAPAPGPAF